MISTNDLLFDAIKKKYKSNLIVFSIFYDHYYDQKIISFDLNSKAIWRLVQIFDRRGVVFVQFCDAIIRLHIKYNKGFFSNFRIKPKTSMPNFKLYVDLPKSFYIKKVLLTIQSKYHLMRNLQKNSYMVSITYISKGSKSTQVRYHQRIQGRPCTFSCWFFGKSKTPKSHSEIN